MHKRFIIKFKSCIDMITLFPTIPAFCQFAMVKSYQGWWSYGCDYIEMMMMMMMMASRTMIMLRRCFAATLNYLGRRGCCRESEEMGEVCAQTTLIAATCLSLEALSIITIIIIISAKTILFPFLCFTFCNVNWFWYDFCSKYYQWLWPLRF